ncbi:MAG: pectinesterase family protein, partial [Spirochaetaceae bacterium]|nr:pectinesterase family protein [Spirochaetaceae bacterium]
MDRLIVVAQDGSGDFTSVGSALAAAERLPPGDLVVLVREGVYFEKLRIARPRLRLTGEGASCSVIRHDDGALRLLPDGQRMGTFNSYTLYVGAPGVRVLDLTIENSAGDGRAAGQAVALYADADDLRFTRCAILGRQDTLFT